MLYKGTYKVCTASVYHWCARYGWFQRQLIVEGTEAEREWRNHRESQRRWRWVATYQTTATYGKPQSLWNWKTKVPASDKHYWLTSFTSCFTHHPSLIPRIGLGMRLTSSMCYQSVCHTTCACVCSYMCIHSPMPKRNHSWHFFQLFGYFPKVQIHSTLL